MSMSKSMFMRHAKKAKNNQIQIVAKTDRTDWHTPAEESKTKNGRHGANEIEMGKRPAERTEETENNNNKRCR